MSNISWNNLDKLESFKKLQSLKGSVSVAKELSGAEGAKRVAEYSIPMGAGLTYNYAAKQVNSQVLSVLKELASESQLLEKFEALYNGDVINTGENRMVLHQLLRGQLGKDVMADGVNKREFYINEQKKMADFANKVHNGEIVNEKGEKFTTVCQIGIGGSDLGPRAIYLALENWAKATGTFKMEARFISNVDPDDAAAVCSSIDISKTIFILVSKSGTTLETLTNESFVKDFITLADATLLLLVSVEQFFHWHSDQRHLQTSLTVLQNRTRTQQKKTFSRTLHFWTHSSVYTKETFRDILQQQFFHIHRLSQDSLHTFSSLIWNQTVSL